MSNESKLRAVIRAAILANEQQDDAQIVASVRELEAVLVEAWMEGKLLGLARAERRAIPDPRQTSFPFPDLSVNVPSKKGFIELGDATIRPLRLWRQQLRQKRAEGLKKCKPNTMLGRVEILIEGMEPYAAANPRLTVRRYREMSESGTPPPPPRPMVMGDAMRRYWDAKTPEERSAIIRARFRKAKARKAAAKKKGRKKGGKGK